MLRAGAPEASPLPTNRIPDWSFAGYAGKDREIPKPNPKAQFFNVKKFGAAGNDKADDSDAIIAAIGAAELAGGGIVSLPAGKYKITKRIKIRSSKVVLRGAGPKKTIIHPALSLWDVDKFEPSNPIPGEYIRPYTRWDGFLSIYGHSSISSDDRPSGSDKEIYTPGAELLATVITQAPAGSLRFEVNDTSRISVGAVVRFFMSDPGSIDLAHELYSNELLKDCPGCLDGFAEGAPDLVHFPSKVVEVGNGFVVLERPVPWPVKMQYRPQIRSYRNDTPMESGIEDLAVVFDHVPATPHLLERGYNGLYLINAANCWVRNVEIVNADNGIIMHNLDFSTVQNITVRVTKPRSSNVTKYDGHIGIGAAFANDVLIEDFIIKRNTIHDLTVRGTAHTVFLRGSGDDLNLDGHRQGPWATLYSQVNVGKGGRTFAKGGNADWGYPLGSYTTYYNIKRDDKLPIGFPGPTTQGPCAFGTRLNFIGGEFGTQGPECDNYWWLNANQRLDFELPQSAHGTMYALAPSAAAASPLNGTSNAEPGPDASSPSGNEGAAEAGAGEESPSDGKLPVGAIAGLAVAGFLITFGE